MKRTLIIAIVFAVAVVTATGLTILLGGSKPHNPNASGPLSTATTPGESPPGQARDSAKALEEQMREAERKKAALLQAQRIAADKVVLVQFRDRLEGVRKLLDERKAEDERWGREVEALLDNDDGRAIVAARFVRDVVALMGERKRYELSEEATRTSVNFHLQPVAAALDDGQAVFSPDSSAISQLARLEAITRDPTTRNRAIREDIRRLVEDARRSGLSTAGQGTTLRAAIDNFRAEEVRQRLIIVHAQMDKQRAVVAEKWAARRVKLIERLTEPKTVEVETAFQSATDKEKFEQPTPAMVAARQTLRDAFGKLEADQIEAEWFYCWRWTLTKGWKDRTADQKAK